MEKESVKKFDLEAAFKALDEIEIPAVEGKGRTKANRVDLKERFSHKPATETLVEDYYDVSNNEDLEEAQEEREGEVAQAKLARIEKIVDLDAETADDLLPSYVGKVIIQCPQCMTLFYKNPEDIEHSDENPDVVNINEVCQHCGNTSGYTLIGKVDSVGADEAEKYEEVPAEENELDLDFDVEEEPAEEEVPTEDDLDLDLDLEEIPEEEPEEEKNESLNLSKKAVSEEESEYKSENLTLNEEATDESLNKSEEAVSEHESENGSENLTLNEEVVTEEIDKDLDKKLKAHNDYIAYLQQMIKQEEEALKGADNDEIKAAIQRRLDAFNADLEAALPDAVKDLRDQSEEIPEVVEAEEVVEEPVEEVKEEEVVEEEPVEEALTEETEECKVVLSDEPEKVVFEGSKEDCEKIIEKNEETETAKEHGLEIIEPEAEVEESLNKSEEAISEHEAEEKSENLTLNESLTEGAESEIDAIIASWGDVNEELTEEGDLDKLLDSEEFKTPVSEEEIDAAREEAEKPVEENLEECNKALTEEPDPNTTAEVDNIINDWKEEDPVKDQPIEECNVAKQEGETLKEEDEEAAEEAEENSVEEPVEVEQPIETTVEEVKEIATEVAEKVVEPVEDEEAAEEQKEEIAEVVDEVVEDKLSEEKPEDEAEAAEEVEEQEIDFDDLQEESFNTRVKDFLTEVYANVSDFAATNCELKEGKLFVEGKISFKSGKEKLTMFEFLPQYSEGKLFFEGFNKDFSEDKAFTLNCSLTEAKELITESFGYKYKINENLVEGLK